MALCVRGKRVKATGYLTTGLVLGTHDASKKKNTYLRALFYRLATRCFPRRAAVAVGRTILQMVYFNLKRHEDHREQEAGYLDQIDRERTSKRLVQRQAALGYEVKMLDLETLRGKKIYQNSPDSHLPIAV